MTRVAVIGTGAMGANHVRVYREMLDIELVAIVDKDRAKAESVGKPYNVRAYDDYHEMLEREQPDAISVVVPTPCTMQLHKIVLKPGAMFLSRNHLRPPWMMQRT